MSSFLLTAMNDFYDKKYVFLFVIVLVIAGVVDIVVRVKLALPKAEKQQNKKTKKGEIYEQKQNHSI